LQNLSNEAICNTAGDAKKVVDDMLKAEE